MAAETLPVIFRKWKNGEVIAIFPTLPFDLDRNCTSYMHVSEHGAANYHLVIAQTQPATDFKDLFKELRSRGYKNLKVYKQAQDWMHYKRTHLPLV